MQNTLCAIMAQILSIYGLVASVIISGNLVEKMALHTGFLQLGAGLAVGLCGLAAGFAIGIVGDAGGGSLLLSRPGAAPLPPPLLTSPGALQSARARSSPASTSAWCSS